MTRSIPGNYFGLQS